MEGYEILIDYFLPVDEIVIVIIIIHGRNPELLRVDDQPPDAAEAVQVHDEEEDELVQLEESLELLG